MIASLGAGAVVMLTKSKSHWLYVHYKDSDQSEKDITLKLDKSEYEKILRRAEASSGKSIVQLSPLVPAAKTR